VRKKGVTIPFTGEWVISPLKYFTYSPQGVGQSVTVCAVKALCDVKVTNSKPAGTKNPSMLRVGVAQVRCDPQVTLMTYIPLSRGFLATG
jgi:hypothetical protein